MAQTRQRTTIRLVLGLLLACVLVSGVAVYVAGADTSSTTPDAPSSVYAKASIDGTVLLNWWPVTTEGEASYRIWRSEDGVSFSQVATVSTDANSYADKGLRTSTRYYYAVSAVDSRGEGPRSASSEPNLAWTAPVTAGPQRPRDLSAVEGSGSVVLGWTPVDNASVVGYIVTRSNRSLGAVSTLTLSPTSLSSWVDTTVVNCNPYWYAVSAVDESGTIGLPSLEVQARPRDGNSAADIHVMGSLTGSAVCERCHVTKWATTESNLLLAEGGPNEVNTCFSCHSAGSGTASYATSETIGDPLAAYGMSVWTSATPDAVATCMTCHKMVVTSGSTPKGLLRASSGVVGQQFCYQCHGGTSTLASGDLSGFEGSGHAVVPLPSSGSEIACAACHETHRSRNQGMTRYAGSMVCMQCHASSPGNPGSFDFWAALTHEDDADTGHLLSRQDLQSGAGMECGNCHNAHVSSADAPLVDPHDPGPQGSWTASRGDEKAFCFRCHDGDPLPTADDTAPWASAVRSRSNATTLTDLAEAFDTNVHGLAASSNAATATAHLRSDMGYAYGVTLACGACHDNHGGQNSFMLRSDVSSADGTRSSDGVLVARIPAGSLSASSPVGYDFRYFCATCHVWDPADHYSRTSADTTSFPVDCSGCHRHVGTDGQPASGL